MAKILVIDDDKGLRNVICRGLRMTGHEVLEAGDGNAGVRLARTALPALVITDIVMPNQEGIETIQGLIGLDPRPAIIAMSGMYGKEGYTPLDDAKLMGAEAVFRKPFVLTELLAEVERLLRPA